MKNTVAYLASPYSHPDPAVREERYQAACRAAAALMRDGQLVYSPIAHSHNLSTYGLPTDWAFWSQYDREMLARCDELLVLMLDGWDISIGVREEIRIALELGKPIRFLHDTQQQKTSRAPRSANTEPGCQATEPSLW
jgi:hypothetical protein